MIAIRNWEAEQGKSNEKVNFDVFQRKNEMERKGQWGLGPTSYRISNFISFCI